MPLYNRFLLRRGALLLSTPILMLPLLSCAPDVDDDALDPIDGKADAWDAENDPMIFGENFEYNWEVLSDEELHHGVSTMVPWPDTYWPMFDDGYNQRWQGPEHMSPVELYDLAFNGWTPPENFMELRRFSQPHVEYDPEYYEALGPAADWAHRYGGSFEARNGIDDNEDGLVDGDWDGLEGWMGHCHAWAPASFSVQEPRRPVTIGGVTFQIADIKALVESTYEYSGSVFLGDRCRLEYVERDEHGRIIDDACRDTNAGSFHVVTLNVVGRLGRSYVMDVTEDLQVWNHPVRDYAIELQEEVTEERALELLNRTDVEQYPYNDSAERFVHVVMNLRYVVESGAAAETFLDDVDSYTRTKRYTYLLELDAQGMIIGGEWVGTGTRPDFMWAPTGNASVRETRTGPALIDAEVVGQLVDMATSDDPIAEGAEHTFESSPGTDILDGYEWGIDDTITVPESMTISGLRVTVGIRHEYAGDLVVSLEREGHDPVVLSDQDGSGHNLNRTFIVNDFNSEDAQGEWTLRVADVFAGDVGRLNSWALVVVTSG